MENLTAFLLKHVPEGMDYEDAAQLCMRLYGTVDGVPEALLPLPTEQIGEAFAELSAAGWVHQDYQADELCGFRYGAHLDDLSTRIHWIKVMRAYLKNFGVVDFKKGEAVARRVGFLTRGRLGEPDTAPNGGTAPCSSKLKSKEPPSVS